MFNRTNFPSPAAPAARPAPAGGASVAGRQGGAAAAGCVAPDGAPFASKFTPGTCQIESDRPVLLGLDNDQLMAQQYNQGAFGTLAFANLAANGITPTNVLGPLLNGPAATPLIIALSFSSSCCWTAAGIYVAQAFVDSLFTTHNVLDASLVALYAGSAYGQSLIGFGQGNTNKVPLNLLTDPRENCVPLIDAPGVDKGSPYIAVFELITRAALGAGGITFLASAYGKSA